MPPAEKQYYVLGQQHLVKALQNLREEVIHNKLDPGRALSVVRAKVLKHNTPVNFRQAAAGDSQFAQSGVRPIPLSQWARLLLSDDIQAQEDETDQIYLSLQRAGYSRQMLRVPLPLLPPHPAPFRDMGMPTHDARPSARARLSR